MPDGIPPVPPAPPRKLDHQTEVILYSPGFSVTIKGDAPVAEAVKEAERIFRDLSHKVPQPGPTGQYA